jgi:hypothetical protein
MPIQQQRPWAVLLCKFSDQSSEPRPRWFYENLFTSAGVGLNNMVDYFRLYSHGSVDIGGSQVIGWLTLPRTLSEYTGSGVNPAGRQQLIQWARDTATANGVNLGNYFNVVVCTNVPVDLFGGGNGMVIGGSGLLPSAIAQEMLHGWGLDHSRADGSDVPYQDQWDVMSVFNAFSAPDPNFTQIGPGLNAANMDVLTWLDSGRVWSGTPIDETVQLRPHHRRDLPGFLVAMVGNFYVEFRMKESWDATIPRPAVLVHRRSQNSPFSYLMVGTSGNRDLGEGDAFQEVALPQNPAVRVEVVSIDSTNRQATVRIAMEQPKQPLVTVPDVVGLPAAVAEAQVRSAQLRPVLAGVLGHGAWVWHLRPIAGTDVTAGSTVTLTLRTGPIP